MKKKLEELLREMDNYDWDNVPDIFPDKELKIEFFKKYLRKAGIEFSGSVLDLCCGPVSFGEVYDNVVGFDIKPQFIKQLRNNGIRGIIGDIRDIPFEDKNFDYVVCSCPPTRPSLEVGYLTHEVLCNPQMFTNRLVDDCLGIARKKVFMISPPIVRHLPRKHQEKIEKLSEIFVVYKV